MEIPLEKLKPGINGDPDSPPDPAANTTAQDSRSTEDNAIGPVTLVAMGTLFVVQLTHKVQTLWDALIYEEKLDREIIRGAATNRDEEEGKRVIGQQARHQVMSCGMFENALRYAHTAINVARPLYESALQAVALLEEKIDVAAEHSYAIESSWKNLWSLHNVINLITIAGLLAGLFTLARNESHSLMGYLIYGFPTFFEDTQSVIPWMSAPKLAFATTFMHVLGTFFVLEYLESSVRSLARELVKSRLRKCMAFMLFFSPVLLSVVLAAGKILADPRLADKHTWAHYSPDMAGLIFINLLGTTFGLFAGFYFLKLHLHKLFKFNRVESPGQAFNKRELSQARFCAASCLNVLTQAKQLVESAKSSAERMSLDARAKLWLEKADLAARESQAFIKEVQHNNS